MAMSEKEKNKVIEAGKIASQIREYAKTIIKKDIPLLEIAEKIESKIIEIGKQNKPNAKPAFPCNLSINDIAAHYTPSFDDKTLAHGLLKVDFGVHIDGYVADTSFSIDLEENREKSETNKKLIQAAQIALDGALKEVKQKGINVSANLIGKQIYETIKKFDPKMTPIINLSGHSIEQYELHSGITIPNIDDNRKVQLTAGVYAIEPFTTYGNGKIYDGKKSGIYQLQNKKNTRSPIARKVLNFIQENYKTLPFCSRWLVKELGTSSLLGLQQLEQQGLVHQYEQLVESSHSNVAQAEHTILITKDKVIVTTE